MARKIKSTRMWMVRHPKGWLCYTRPAYTQKEAKRDVCDATCPWGILHRRGFRIVRAYLERDAQLASVGTALAVTEVQLAAMTAERDAEREALAHSRRERNQLVGDLNAQLATSLWTIERINGRIAPGWFGKGGWAVDAIEDIRALCSRFPEADLKDGTDADA